MSFSSQEIYVESALLEARRRGYVMASGGFLTDLLELENEDGETLEVIAVQGNGEGFIPHGTIACMIAAGLLRSGAGYNQFVLTEMGLAQANALWTERNSVSAQLRRFHASGAGVVARHGALAHG